MIGMLAIGASGLVAGSLHVLSGPDHLAAVAPLAADSQRSPWRAGLVWALGHTGGVLAVGAITLILRELLPIERLSSVSERIVGIALIVVGLWGIRRAMRTRLHAHSHTHGGVTHTHVHLHEQGAADPDHAIRKPHDHVHVSFFFGVLHGLAGSSHFFGVLPALALPTRAASLAYLVAYGVGTVAAMTSFSTLIGVAASRTRGRDAELHTRLLYACSVSAIVVGGVWITM